MSRRGCRLGCRRATAASPLPTSPRTNPETSKPHSQSPRTSLRSFHTPCLACIRFLLRFYSSESHRFRTGTRRKGGVARPLRQCVKRLGFFLPLVLALFPPSSFCPTPQSSRGLSSLRPIIACSLPLPSSIADSPGRNQVSTPSGAPSPRLNFSVDSCGPPVLAQRLQQPSFAHLYSVLVDLTPARHPSSRLSSGRYPSPSPTFRLGNPTPASRSFFQKRPFPRCAAPLSSPPSASSVSLRQLSSRDGTMLMDASCSHRFCRSADGHPRSRYQSLPWSCLPVRPLIVCQ